MMFNSLNGILQNHEPQKQAPEFRLKSFGEVHDNCNWVECPSKKNPGRNYYFNVRSHCTIWKRPVPKNIQLPFFNPHAIPRQTMDNENERSPPVSELDDCYYQDDEENETRENQVKREFYKTASKIFYHGFPYFRRTQRIFGEIPGEDSDICESNPISDFLEVEYLSKDSAKRLRSSSSSSEPSEESNIESSKESSNSSCHCSCCDVKKDDSEDKSQSYDSSISCQSLSSTFSAPRLKQITLDDLVTEPVKKLRRRKKRKIEPSKEMKPKLTPEKIICDMHGIRTISFDPIFEYINPTVPADVRPEHLSDSSINSPNNSEIIPNNDNFSFFDVPLNIRDLVLSEVSSGSESTEPLLESDVYSKQVSPSKIIWRPWIQEKKSYKDILGGKVLCINLQRIDLDKDYCAMIKKNKVEDSKPKKGELKEDSKTDTGKYFEEKKRGRGRPKKLDNFRKESWESDESFSKYIQIEDSETNSEKYFNVKKRGRGRPKKVDHFRKQSYENLKSNKSFSKDIKIKNSEVEGVRKSLRSATTRNRVTPLYYIPDSETEDECLEVNRIKRKSKDRKGSRRFLKFTDTEEEKSQVEKRNETFELTEANIKREYSEGGKVEDSENETSVHRSDVRVNNIKDIEDGSIENSEIEQENSEREDTENSRFGSDESSSGESDGQSVDGDKINRNCVGIERNSNFGWVSSIVNSETTKLRIKKISMSSASTESEKTNSKTDSQNGEIKENPEESANKSPENGSTYGKIEGLRVSLEGIEVPFTCENNDSDVPTENITEDLRIREWRENSVESFHSMLSLKEFIFKKNVISEDLTVVEEINTRENYPKFVTSTLTSKESILEEEVDSDSSTLSFLSAQDSEELKEKKIKENRMELHELDKIEEGANSTDVEKLLLMETDHGEKPVDLDEVPVIEKENNKSLEGKPIGSTIEEETENPEIETEKEKNVIEDVYTIEDLSETDVCSLNTSQNTTEDEEGRILSEAETIDGDVELELKGSSDSDITQVYCVPDSD